MSEDIDISPQKGSREKIMYYKQKQFRRAAWNVSAAVLYLISIGILVIAVHAPPSLAVFCAWYASVTSNTPVMQRAAKKLEVSGISAYHKAGLYYSARSEIVRSSPARENFLHASQYARGGQYSKSGIRLPKKFYLQDFLQGIFLSAEPLDKDFQMLIGYTDFYLKRYAQAKETYWNILINYPNDAAVRRNYEIALFYFNYTSSANPGSSQNEPSERSMDGKDQTLPVSLYKLEFGNTYYMRERLQNTSNLPSY